jgi:hypothetical protein
MHTLIQKDQNNLCLYDKPPQVLGNTKNTATYKSGQLTKAFKNARKPPGCNFCKQTMQVDVTAYIFPLVDSHQQIANKLSHIFNFHRLPQELRAKSFVAL